MFPIFASENML